MRSRVRAKRWRRFLQKSAPNESRANTTITVMSSGVETSRIVTFKAVPRDSSTTLGTTIFAVLDTYHDHAPHSAAMNMAIDEALLEVVRVPSVRFYPWGSPALSFGYFGKFADIANYAGERDLVRRWTGGGVVFHGDDLTYAIVIPSNDPVFGESSKSIYVTIHAALRDALIANGEPAHGFTCPSNGQPGCFFRLRRNKAPKRCPRCRCDKPAGICGRRPRGS